MGGGDQLVGDLLVAESPSRNIPFKGIFGGLEGLEVDAVLADKGYDSDAVIDRIVATGAEAVIPPKANRKFSGPAIMPCIANAISSNGSSIN